MAATTVTIRPNSDSTPFGSGTGFGSLGGSTAGPTESGTIGDNDVNSWITRMQGAAKTAYYGMSDAVISASNTIVQVRTAVQGGGSNRVQAKLMTELNGKTNTGSFAGTQLAVSYGTTPQYSTWQTVDPAGQPWTSTSINALKLRVDMPTLNSGESIDLLEAWMEVQYFPAPTAAPTTITPAAASTQTVPNPTLGATLVAIAAGQKQRAEWQLATNSTFTANVNVITEPSDDNRLSGATTEAYAVSNLALANGTWYVRARALDEYGAYGPYSASQSFTVNTPPPGTPTAVTPAAAATVTTQMPTLGATVPASNNRAIWAEWTLATDSGFTTDVRTLTQDQATEYSVITSAVTKTLPSSLKLTKNGTWYVRARTLAEDGTSSAWSAAQSFTVALVAPPAPTTLTPAAGSTVTTNNPTVGATVVAAAEGRKSRVEWNFAKDSGFTVGLVSAVEDPSDQRTSGATTELLDATESLTQAVWYMRARQIDELGYTGAWSASQTFTVAHKPNTSSQSPTGAAVLKYAATTTLSWTFSDPSGTDSQKAYQIVVERNDTGANILDTGKVTSTAKTYAATIPTKDVQLRWKIQVWDQDDVSSGYSNLQLFTLTDPPTVTVTTPANGGTVATGRPTVSWTLDAQTTQKTYRVLFQTTAGVTVQDSGTLTSATVRSYTPPSNILTNTVSYKVAVTVTDIDTLSTTTTNTFTATYPSPNPTTFTVDSSVYDTAGYVNIDWSQMQPDTYFSTWRVYRKELNSTSWDMLLETGNITRVNYHDWTALSGYSYQYAVTQVAERSGTYLESTIDTNTALQTTVTGEYWLINILDETMNLHLFQVTGDSYTREVEQESYIVINRGRKTNYGTDLGKSGSLNAQLRDNAVMTAHDQNDQLEMMQRSRATYLLRDPFGNILQVSLGSIDVSRIPGVGTSEFVDVTIPYSEVI